MTFLRDLQPPVLADHGAGSAFLPDNLQMIPTSQAQLCRCAITYSLPKAEKCVIKGKKLWKNEL